MPYLQNRTGSVSVVDRAENSCLPFLDLSIGMRGDDFNDRERRDELMGALPSPLPTMRHVRLERGISGLLIQLVVADRFEGATDTEKPLMRDSRDVLLAVGEGWDFPVNKFVDGLRNDLPSQGRAGRELELRVHLGRDRWTGCRRSQGRRFRCGCLRRYGSLISSDHRFWLCNQTRRSGRPTTNRLRHVTSLQWEARARSGRPDARQADRNAWPYLRRHGQERATAWAGPRQRRPSPRPAPE
ncbi:hypothetical protein SAMN05216276_107816 [Streptosporangium subroseum]|uniref:Uncharacterized protein n=1 Tax=Streptosporangium subroseum TaxID=106412 RepID=A0A239P1N4_9ACTN|nr:hypothetical protein SAMN05216276_107816 [Streptosporangium subroseum]